MRHCKLTVLVGIGALWVTAMVGAQEPIRVDVRLINVHATVTDAAGRHVGGLRAEDFTVEEDGVAQKVVHFSQDRDVPVSVGILLDTSASMERKIRTATSAVDRFLRTLHKDDDIFLMGFARRVDLLQDFTNNRDKLARELRSIDLSLGTVLYDAVRDGLKKIRSGRHDKKAILIITDGENAGGSTTRAQATAAVRDSEVLVYALGTAAQTYADNVDHVPFTWPIVPGLSQTPQTAPAASRIGARAGALNRAMDSVNMNVLNELGEASGGRAFLIAETFVSGSTTQMDAVLGEIADELRSQYTLGYYPASSGNGQYHNLRVTTSRSGATVRVRQGYRLP